jgi:hypothetical protein
VSSAVGSASLQVGFSERVRQRLPAAGGQLLVVHRRPRPSLQGWLGAWKVTSVATAELCRGEAAPAPPPPGTRAILLDEVVRACDPLELLGCCWGRLEDGGPLLIVERLSQVERGPESRDVYDLPTIRFLAVGCGFAVLEVAPLAGPGGWTLIALRKDGRCRWHLGLAAEGDFPAIAGLFREVFQRPMTRALWEWKYGEGRGRAVLVWRGERLVAHYGGMRRRISYLGCPALGCQIGDVMVQVDERGVLTRRGPFFLATAGFGALYAGYGSEHRITFGFPNERHARLGQRLGLYSVVGKIVELCWRDLSAGRRAGRRVRPLNGRGWRSWERLVARLWRQMRRDLQGAVVGVRDWSYLRHRYLLHPEHDYRLFLLLGPLGLRPYGLFVLRPLGRRCELVDLLGGLQHLPEVVRSALPIARRLGAEEVFGWITEGFAPLLGVAGATVRDPGIPVPTITWTPGPDPAQFRGRWWLMAGDSDFH